jgi:hypothetical protein
MFKFLMGVAFGAAGYWAWQSFGRDLLGMGGDQETSYGGFNSSPSGTGSFSSPASSTPASTGSSSTTTPPSTSTPAPTTTGSTPTSGSSTTAKT